jgi:hypothetical protein
MIDLDEVLTTVLPFIMFYSLCIFILDALQCSFELPDDIE